MNFEPFCVETSKLTREQAFELLDKAVAAGAHLYETTYGYQGGNSIPKVSIYVWEYIGVSSLGRTFLSDSRESYEGNIIEFDELDEWLGINNKDQEVKQTCTITKDYTISLSGYQLELVIDGLGKLPKAAALELRGILKGGI